MPSFFFCFRGGVTGRPDPMPPYMNFAFFSAGLRIWERTALSGSTSRVMEDGRGRTWKLQRSVSSTDIIAPALSNLWAKKAPEPSSSDDDEALRPTLRNSWGPRRG